MNILLQFEDKHGCSSLFKNYFPECEKYLDFNNGLSNSGVFSIEGSLLANYDLTIFVYDLDSYGDGSLMLKEESFDAATNWMLPYIDKIVFIPVFFCFETLVLFSYQFKEILSNNNALTKVLLHYAKYYDYSKVIPEVLYNYKNNLNGVSKYNQDKNIFYPQMFHQEYLKNLLQVMYPNISAKKLEDKFKNKKLEIITNISEKNIYIDHIEVPQKNFMLSSNENLFLLIFILTLYGSGFILWKLLQYLYRDIYNKEDKSIMSFANKLVKAKEDQSQTFSPKNDKSDCH